LRTRATLVPALLLLASLGHATLNSPEPWLFGTLPYESVPRLEENAAYQFSVPKSASPEHGVGVQAGWTDHWEAGVEAGYQLPPDGLWSLAGTLRGRLGEQGTHVLDLGALLRGGLERGSAFVLAGPVLARQWAEQDFAVNLLAGVVAGQGRLQFRGGWRSAYWLESLRLGLEGRLEGGADEDLRAAGGPQLALDLPGDLSLGVGIEFSREAWEARLRVSYLIFPNP
jgi:hypothetical protein